jgi:hypothetical protein
MNRTLSKNSHFLLGDIPSSLQNHFSRVLENLCKRAIVETAIRQSIFK